MGAFGLIAALVFIGAAFAGIGVIVVMVAPQWRRILRLAGGEISVPDTRPIGRPTLRFRQQTAL